MYNIILILHINLKKCNFIITSFLFLGYVVSVDGIKVDEEKIRTMKDWPTPITIVQVQSFHGKSFTMIKEKLCFTHVVVLLNFDKLFKVKCDAFIVGIRSVL
ncbi:unnamed protein product [Spirodela intermedia]|uniref:Uncharacterized protein n=1 Tax=Spirodela intermedia TaxID=51605 RepID=A0A7I8KQG6_SPIIN|nr:unnamed protein product [Spirodela intermedia]